MLSKLLIQSGRATAGCCLARGGGASVARGRAMATLGSSTSNVKYTRIQGFDVPTRLVDRWKLKQKKSKAEVIGQRDAEGNMVVRVRERTAGELAADALLSSGAAAGLGQQPSAVGVGGDPAVAELSSSDVLAACQHYFSVHGNVPSAWLLHTLNRAGVGGADGAGHGMTDFYACLRAWQFFESWSVPFASVACSDALIRAAIRTDATRALVKLLRRSAPGRTRATSFYTGTLNPTAGGWLTLLRAVQPDAVASVWACIQARAFDPSPKMYVAVLRQSAAAAAAANGADTAADEVSGPTAGNRLTFVSKIADLAVKSSSAPAYVATVVSLWIKNMLLLQGEGGAAAALDLHASFPTTTSTTAVSRAKLVSLAHLAGSTGDQGVSDAAALLQSHWESVSADFESHLNSLLDTASQLPASVQTSVGPRLHALFGQLQSSNDSMTLPESTLEKLNSFDIAMVENEPES